MLLNKETEQEYGYLPESLSKGSSKSIITQCDYCDKQLKVKMKDRTKANSVVQKDSCKECRYKKREDMSLAKHGVKNSAQRSDVKEKIKKNCTFNQEGFKEKRKKTMIEKYGVEYATQNEELREKTKQTIKEKYGVSNVSEVPAFQEKRRQTNLDRYGNESFLGSEEGERRKKEGLLKKYGVENAFQSEEVKEKIKQTNLKKYGVEHRLKDKEVAKSVSKKGLQTRIDTGQVRVYEDKTVSEWASKIGYSSSRFNVLVGKHGFEKAIQMQPYISSLEQGFRNWLEKEEIKYTHSFKVERKIADFLVNGNIIIELDGLFWHSEHITKDNMYHYNKKELYNKYGYKSFFFREDEINNKFPIIQSILNNALGKSNRIYARKCTVKEIPSKTATPFFSYSHLMGRGRGIPFGLFYNDTLISCMQFRKTKNGYDISRFCNKLGYSVIGGFSKLLKAFGRKYNPENITTFVDRRYGTGDYLCGFGFKQKTCYPSFKWTDGTESFHRLKFTGNSGYDKGLIKIWDCGQSNFVLEYKKEYN